MITFIMNAMNNWLCSCSFDRCHREIIGIPVVDPPMMRV
jgi:hypothetical protein